MGSIIRAVENLEIDKNDIVAVSGIGCSSSICEYLDFHTLHAIHGRAIVCGTIVKFCRPELKVLVAIGDGDACAIGGNHLINAARRNIDITVIIMNNNFGLFDWCFCLDTYNRRSIHILVFLLKLFYDPILNLTTV